MRQAGIVLTGDIHHNSLRTQDQRFLTISEPQTALEYADIARQHGIKVTLFASGKAVKEEPDVFNSLASMENVELGGHNYYCFKPKLFYAASRRLFGLSNGLRLFQDWEIKKTKQIFKNMIGVDIISWRDHGYRTDKNTLKLLEQNGIKLVSNDVGPNFANPFPLNSNLMSLPVNVLPDHDHLIHGSVVKKASNCNSTVATELKRSKFKHGIYDTLNWEQMVKKQTGAMIEQNCIATLLVHPCCMKILDNFSVFRKLCGFFNSFCSLFAKDTIQVNLMP